MELQDFTEFQPFNSLREKMGTDKLGFFELFDPSIHLTGSERSELENVGVLLRPEQIKILPDKTLALKNSRVLAYNPDENFYRAHREYPTFHVAMCSQLEEIKNESPRNELLVTTRLDEEYNLVKIKSSGEVSMVSHGFVVCKHCLHALRYKNYDEFRNRRRGHSQKILGDFKLQEFYRLYQQYPLSFRAKRED